MSDFHLNCALRALNEGGVIAYPTESVFGLGCYPENFNAITKILSLKNRSLGKGLILVAASVEQITPYVNYPDNELKREIIATWPGAVTWVLSAKGTVPPWITGYKATVAVRVSAHPVVRGLCNKAGVIVSTSANPSSKAPATNVPKIRSYFGNKIDYILPGSTGNKNLPTEIRDAITGNVIRSSG